MENWKQSAIYLRLERGFSWMEIVDELQDFFPGKNKEQVKEFADIVRQLGTVGNYSIATPQTKVWLVRRNKTICDRLMKKLSQESD